MTRVIRIQERGQAGEATLIIDGVEYPIRVSDPFSAKEEQELAWYFEELPFAHTVRAEEQHLWQQATDHYQHSLALKEEFHDRYSQARTYHQLGRVAEEQQQWKQAAQYFLTALEIWVEFEDDYSIETFSLPGLFRVWREGRDEGIIERTAGVLGWKVEEVRELFGKALEQIEEEEKGGGE